MPGRSIRIQQFINLKTPTLPSTQILRPNLFTTLSKPFKPSIPTPHIPRLSPFTTTTATKNMASDEAYSSFLDKANAPTSNPRSGLSAKSTSATPHHAILAASSSVPKGLKALESKTYTSESDEPFQAFSIPYEGDGEGLNATTFREAVMKAVEQEGDVEVTELKREEFEASGDYGDVLRGVEKESSDGSVKVFKWEGEGSRVWYYAVGLGKGGKRLVGLRALSVES